MKKSLFLILPLAALIVGCLGDTVDGPQNVVKSIFPPGKVYYKCITNTTNLQILWNPPIVDTQANFKGYLVVLYNSKPFQQPSDDGIDSVSWPNIDSVQVPVTDTMWTFIGKVVQDQRYTVRVWGVRNSKPDTLILSLGSAGVSFNFDAKPVLAPTMIFASSATPNIVNIFWYRSASESQVGMYGYVIRFKDTTHTNSVLQTFTARPPIDSNKTSPYYHFAIAVPPNTFQPYELPYKFWIKAIRKDSIESDDSVGISWSGAERIPVGILPVKLDTGIIMGAIGFVYNLVQTDPNDPNVLTQLKVSSSNNTIVVDALNNTKFVNHVEKDTNLTLDNNFFAAPFLASDFTETQLTFAATGSDRGAIIYALFNDGNRARIWFSKSDSTGGSYVRPDRTIQIQASFQPTSATRLPFF